MLECVCGWQGDETELVCSDEDATSGKEVFEMTFSICPLCGSDDLEDMDDDEVEDWLLFLRKP